MKNKYYLLIVAILLATKLVAQTDSTYFYLDKSTLTNNVLCNFGDSVYWGMFDGGVY